MLNLMKSLMTRFAPPVAEPSARLRWQSDPLAHPHIRCMTAHEIADLPLRSAVISERNPGSNPHGAVNATPDCATMPRGSTRWTVGRGAVTSRITAAGSGSER